MTAISTLKSVSAAPTKKMRVATGPARAHVELVLRGKEGTAMPAFGAQLDDVEIAAVVSYERQSWGNGAEPVQPALVQGLRP